MTDTDVSELPESLGKRARRPYRLLKGRGEDEAAERLASLSLYEQNQFVKNEFRDHDPKHDDPANSEHLVVKNVYGALVELGYDEAAERLRGITSSGRQKQRAKELAEEVDAKIDPVTGDFDPRPGGGGE